MRRLLRAAAAGLALCLTACAASAGFTGGERLSDGVKANPDAAVTYRYADGATETPAAYHDFAGAAVTFSLRLFRSAYDSGVTALTPADALLQLGLLANGAKGDTRTEILTTLGMKGGLDTLNPCCSYFKSRMNTVGKAALTEDGQAAPLTVGGALFLNAGADVRATFLQANADFYGDDVICYDFANGTDKLRDYLGDRLTLGADERMASFTELTLRDRWLNPSLTAEEYVMTTKTAQGVIKYTADNPLKALFIQPTEGSLADYIKTFDSAEYGRLLDSVDVTKREQTAIPAFQTQARSDDLSQNLAQIGLRTLFGDKADFSALVYNEGLTLDAFCVSAPALTVTAQGVAAGGAATADAAAPAADVTIARPFLFLLIDNETDIPIYIAAIE